MTSTDSAADDVGSPVAPVRIHREDVPADQRHSFDADPVLTVHDGPWSYERSPRAGAALSIAAWVVVGVSVIAIVVDQFRPEPFLYDGNMIGAAGVFTLLALILIGGPGAFLSQGKFRHTPSGRRLRQSHRHKHGFSSLSAAAAVHAALTSGEITTRSDLISTAQRGGYRNKPKDELFVTPYEAAKRDDYAIVAVYFKSDDGEYAIWPPVPISPDRIGALLPPHQDGFDVSAATSN